jgi:hypothetical protein
MKSCFNNLNQHSVEKYEENKIIDKKENQTGQR